MSVPSLSKELQLWATVRSKLVALRDCQRRAEQSATAINSLQTQWQGLIDRRRKLNGRPSEGGEEEDDDEDDNDIASDEDEAEERIHMQNKIESQYEKLRLESDEEKRYVRSLPTWTDLIMPVTHQLCGRLVSPPKRWNPSVSCLPCELRSNCSVSGFIPLTNAVVFCTRQMVLKGFIMLLHQSLKETNERSER